MNLIVAFEFFAVVVLGDGVCVVEFSVVAVVEVEVEGDDVFGLGEFPSVLLKPLLVVSDFIFLLVLRPTLWSTNSVAEARGSLRIFLSGSVGMVFLGYLGISNVV